MADTERRTLRVFISSPADVRPERLIAERVVQRLDQEFAPNLDLRAVSWEREPLLASHHFQDLITPPRDTDIVVVILWSLLGTQLPADRSCSFSRASEPSSSPLDARLQPLSLSLPLPLQWSWRPLPKRLRTLSPVQPVLPYLLSSLACPPILP